MPKLESNRRFGPASFQFSVTRKDFGSMQLAAKIGKFNISMLRPSLLKTGNWQLATIVAQTN
jgi:hypothetical protein